jgi:hypothetical protein
MFEEFNRPTPFAATSTSNTKEGSMVYDHDPATCEE